MLKYSVRFGTTSERPWLSQRPAGGRGSYLRGHWAWVWRWAPRGNTKPQRKWKTWLRSAGIVGVAEELWGTWGWGAEPQSPPPLSHASFLQEVRACSARRYYLLKIQWILPALNALKTIQELIFKRFSVNCPKRIFHIKKVCFGKIKIVLNCVNFKCIDHVKAFVCHIEAKHSTSSKKLKVENISKCNI